MLPISKQFNSISIFLLCKICIYFSTHNFSLSLEFSYILVVEKTQYSLWKYNETFEFAKKNALLKYRNSNCGAYFIYTNTNTLCVECNMLTIPREHFTLVRSNHEREKSERRRRRKKRNRSWILLRYNHLFDAAINCFSLFLLTNGK